MPTLKAIDSELDWLRKCCLISLFHFKKSEGTKRPNKWKISDTSSELGYSTGYVSEALLLAKYQDKIYHCKSREEALKRLKDEQ